MQWPYILFSSSRTLPLLLHVIRDHWFWLSTWFDWEWLKYWSCITLVLSVRVFPEIIVMWISKTRKKHPPWMWTSVSNRLGTWIEEISEDLILLSHEAPLFWGGHICLTVMAQRYQNSTIFYILKVDLIQSSPSILQAFRLTKRSFTIGPSCTKASSIWDWVATGFSSFQHAYGHIGSLQSQII